MDGDTPGACNVDTGRLTKLNIILYKRLLYFWHYVKRWLKIFCANLPILHDIFVCNLFFEIFLIHGLFNLRKKDLWLIVL